MKIIVTNVDKSRNGLRVLLDRPVITSNEGHRALRILSLHAPNGYEFSGRAILLEPPAQDNPKINTLKACRQLMDDLAAKPLEIEFKRTGVYAERPGGRLIRTPQELDRARNARKQLFIAGVVCANMPMIERDASRLVWIVDGCQCRLSGPPTTACPSGWN